MWTGLRKGFLIALIPLALVACGKDEPKQQPRVKRARPAAKPPVVAQAPVQEAKAPEAKAEEINARYRNPFQSHIMIMRGTEVEKKIRGPLECCDLDQFRVVAVVVGQGEGYALVQAPDKKRYVVKRGDAMGPRDGKVVKITGRGLIVREYVRDEEGKVVGSHDLEVNLPQKKGSGAPGFPG
ncbi:MAG: pilus assembly protein PilP [Thermodesulfobacteriota bacterium]